MDSALPARKRCSRSGSKPCPGRSTAFPARKKWNRDSYNPPVAFLPKSLITLHGATDPPPYSPCRSLYAGTAAPPQTAAPRRRSARSRLGAVFAFGKGGRVDNLRVLLLDDVMGAGTTLDACAQAFCEAAAVRHANPVVGKS